MQAPQLWPELQPGKLSTVPELRSIILTITTSTADFISMYSAYSKLLFVTGWILRFIQNARIRDPNKRELLCHISGKDTQVAEQVLIRMQQDEEFPEERARVSKGGCVSRSSCLRYLDAILGKDGLLRVGGRLENAPINVDQRHPPILHGSHQITKLLIHHLHVTHHHAGPSTLMGILAANYYVLRARVAVRNVVRCCVICRRRNFKTIQQRMGQLPAARVTPAPPFSIVGVDFAGPITTGVGKVRKPTKLKAYISVFVCSVTKATHLEPVSDLSTRAFVAALRFVAR